VPLVIVSGAGASYPATAPAGDHPHVSLTIAITIDAMQHTTRMTIIATHSFGTRQA
jgi:hypothetical protein